jgi:8-amino-7-oxononanoate synthase
LAPPVAAAGLAALDVVRDEPQRRVELLRRAEELRGELVERGWNVGASASQIIPLMAGDAAQALVWSRRLKEMGLLVPAIRPPSVPRGESLLRVSLTWGHTPEMIERLVESLAELAPAQARL